MRREVVVGVDAATAWGLVGRPELLHLWFPGVVACRVEGETRTITLGTGLTLDEAILTLDPLQRRFQYRIRGGFFTEHLASVDVIALAERTCLVTYASDAAPAAMAVVLGGATAAALAELKHRLEADHETEHAAPRSRRHGSPKPSAVCSTSNSATTCPSSSTMHAACASVAQSTPPWRMVGSCMSASSLLQQWGSTRWSMDVSAGRSLIGAR